MEIKKNIEYLVSVNFLKIFTLDMTYNYIKQNIILCFRSELAKISVTTS